MHERSLPRLRPAAVVLCGLALFAGLAPVRADQPLTPLDTSVSDATLDKRLRFIEERLDGSRTHGQIWYWGWMTVDAGSAVWLGIDAGLANHEDDAVNSGVNAGMGAIGVADLLLRPLQARHGADPVRDMPEATRTEKIAKLRAAEELLHGNAQRAEDRTSLAMHAGNVALNGAAGLIVGIAGRQMDGIITFAAGTVGGIVNLLTAPWAPEQDWQDYKALISGESRAHSRFDIAIAPLVDGGAHLALCASW